MPQQPRVLDTERDSNKRDSRHSISLIMIANTITQLSDSDSRRRSPARILQTVLKVSISTMSRRLSHGVELLSG